MAEAVSHRSHGTSVPAQSSRLAEACRTSSGRIWVRPATVRRGWNCRWRTLDGDCRPPGELENTSSRSIGMATGGSLRLLDRSLALPVPERGPIHARFFRTIPMGTSSIRGVWARRQ